MKKIISAILSAVVFMSAAMSTTAFAAANDVTTEFEQSSYAVQADEEFDVSVNVTDNPIGFNNATIYIKYDPNVIQAVTLDQEPDDYLKYDHSSGLYSLPLFSQDLINAQITTVPAKSNDDYDKKADGKKTAAQIGIIKISALISDYATTDEGRVLKNLEGTGKLLTIRFKAIADGTTDITIDDSNTGSFIGGIQKFKVLGCSTNVTVGNGGEATETTTAQGSSSSDDETTEATTVKGSNGGGSSGGGNRESTTVTTVDETTEETTVKAEETTEATTNAAGRMFNDIEDYPWAVEYIEKLASQKIINGYSDGSFKPNDNIKRADFILMLMKTIDADTSALATDNFDDVNPLAYYANAVGAAKKLGIASGNGDGTFSPESQITRQDMMILAKKALEYTTGEEISGDVSTLDKFNDKEDISAYARESLAAMVDAGIVNGMGDGIAPKNNTTRAQAAVIMSKIYDKIK